MKTAKQILSDITGYTVEELTERNTEPLLQAEDCLTAMYCFLAQQQANGVTNRTFKCNRCGTIYTLIDGDTVGCCVMPVEHRTSGICGGELIEVI